MEEQILFDESGVKLTPVTLYYDNKKLSLSSIDSVLYIKEPFSVRDLIINVVLAIAGLIGIFSFKMVWLIIGIIALAIGGFNSKNMIRDIKDPIYIVCVKLHSGESVYIERRSIDFANKLTNALNSVLIQ